MEKGGPTSTNSHFDRHNPKKSAEGIPADLGNNEEPATFDQAEITKNPQEIEYDLQGLEVAHTIRSKKKADFFKFLSTERRVKNRTVQEYLDEARDYLAHLSFLSEKRQKLEEYIGQRTLELRWFDSFGECLSLETTQIKEQIEQELRAMKAKRDTLHHLSLTDSIWLTHLSNFLWQCKEEGNEIEHLDCGIIRFPRELVSQQITPTPSNVVMTPEQARRDIPTIDELLQKIRQISAELT